MITVMNNVILIPLASSLIVVVIVLLIGVVGVARGGDFNAKYGNKLMRLRVILQGPAIVLFILLLVTSERE
jgi:hypothetical protein